MCCLSLHLPQALAPATTVDAGGNLVPSMLVRLDRCGRLMADAGAALLEANARLHWGGAASAGPTPSSRRAS